MHLITLTEPVNLGKTLGVLAPGTWLVEDLNAFEIAQMAKRGTATVNDWLLRPGADRKPDSGILIMRSGAIGDLLLLTPALLELKVKTGYHISLCCFPKHFPLFAGNQSVDDLVAYPLKFSEAQKYQTIISLENTMESDHTQHATDVFAKALAIQTPLYQYRPLYFVTDAEKAATKQHLFAKRPNIVLQLRASVANRDYPPSQWLEVIVKLEQQGWGVLLVGYKGQIPPLPPQFQNVFIRDLSQLDLTFREVAAVLAQAQAFCGVDSSFSHLCHALDIPAVVLFGPFSWETRTSKAPKTIALSGVGPCAPCSWHMHAGRAFPPNKPCTAVQQCVVLAGISPDRILAKISLLKP